MDIVETDDKLDIFETAQFIKYKINEVFAEHGEDVPERQYIYAGQEPVHDCEQLTIGFIQHYPGRPGDQGQLEYNCHNKERTAVFTIELVRECAPTFTNTKMDGTTSNRYSSMQKPPSVEDFEKDAQRKLIDSRLLLEAGLRAIEGRYDGLGLTGLADVSAGELSGQYQAMILNLVLVVQ